MRIVSMSLAGFRGYKNQIKVSFGSLTAFVGKNDIGKSSILEALDIFFNDGKTCGKLEKTDINKSFLQDGNDEIVISVEFSDLPERITIDATVETTLSAEYMLNNNGNLEIVKKYKNTGSPKVYIRAMHPTTPCCANLLQKKNAELRAIIRENNIICENQNANAPMRTAIWRHYADDLQIQEIEIETAKEDAKEIWSKLNSMLPNYALFQSDRKNTDGDTEIQDPLQLAVKQIINDERIRNILANVATEVRQKLKEVSDRTLAKLREMDPAVANSLNPEIISPDKLKWADVFKSVSITGDADIPINKRGSGVRRLILLNFFRAEAERQMTETQGSGIIYAIEEPETSQHAANQKILIEALKSLADADNSQVIITTHSSIVVKNIGYPNIRLITENETDGKTVQPVQSGLLGYPSMNEINYNSFGEITEEFHNELYAFIDLQGWLNEYKTGKPTRTYNQWYPDTNRTVPKQLIMSEIVRHQIHHPENTHNPRFTEADLKTSIQEMMNFISSKNQQITQAMP